MALYIAEDGTIHDRNVGNCTQISTINGRVHRTEVKPIQKSTIWMYWIITLLVSLSICASCHKGFGDYLYSVDTDSSGMIESVCNFISSCGPYLFYIFGLGACIFYGTILAPTRNYDLISYGVSILFATFGCVVSIIVVFLLELCAAIVINALYIVFIILLICMIF